LLGNAQEVAALSALVRQKSGRHCYDPADGLSTADRQARVDIRPFDYQANTS